MSLIESIYEPLCFMEKTRVSDGQGGYVTTLTAGAEFQAAVTFDSSLQARVAEKQGVTALYTITTPKSVSLDYHDVVKRIQTGQLLRVTSTNDKATPPTAGISFKQVTAEEWTQ